MFWWRPSLFMFDVHNQRQQHFNILSCFDGGHFVYRNTNVRRHIYIKNNTLSHYDSPLWLECMSSLCIVYMQPSPLKPKGAAILFMYVYTNTIDMYSNIQWSSLLVIRININLHTKRRLHTRPLTATHLGQLSPCCVCPSGKMWKYTARSLRLIFEY